MSVLLLITILIPIATGSVVFLFKGLKFNHIRGIVFLGVLASSVLTWWLALSGTTESFTLVNFTSDLSLTLQLDGCGRIFALISATLWPLTALYSFEYMKDHPRLHLFYGFFTASYGATLAVAFADNLITLYLFFEMLTLTTIPLVLYYLTDEAKRAARYYMYYSIGGAAFAFMGVICVTVLGTNHGQFVMGGSVLMAASEYPFLMRTMYVLSFVGFSVKAALFPCSAWLPRASVAPTPVTALLHAVAVVKAGAFAVIRLTYYGYGTNYIKDTWAQYVVLALTAITILYGSVQAVRQQHFKRRLAYSTVANMSYILMGVALMTDAGLVAASSHMVFHSIIKIVAFFAAGAVQHHAKCNYLQELDGIGRKMPVTFTCFTAAALALVGIPPFNGFVSKWYLGMAAIAQGSTMGLICVIVLMISAFLTLIYMFQAVVRAWFYPSCQANAQATEAGPAMTVPMVLLSVAILATGLFAGDIMGWLSSLLGV